MSEQQKTTKCPKCQEEIIAGAQKCKHCGSDLRVWWKRHKILTGIGIFFVLVIISAAFSSGDKENGASSAPEQAQTTKETPVKLSGIKISASQLYAAYTANEIKADDMYKNKILEVSGSVSSIGKDIMDNPYVVLKTSDLLGGIQCMLTDEEKSKAGKLSKGNLITVVGKNTGKMMNILLDECSIK